MTLTFVGIAATGLMLGWERWMLPFYALGVIASWVLHIRSLFLPRRRLYFYMFVIWMLLVYHGVHATSFNDIAGIAAIEFAMLALTDEKMLVNIGFVLYWFCYFWSGSQLIREGAMVFDALTLAPIALHVCVVVTTYIVARDIINKRAREREAAKEEIDELLEVRSRSDDFLIGVSHAFRTPVNIVTGISRVLAGREKDADAKRGNTHVMEAGMYMSGRLDDLLDYTELETGRFRTGSEPYMIGSVLNDVLTTLRLYRNESRIQVIVDVDADVPAVLRGDARRIKKILFHLIDNALRYTVRGGVYVRVYAVREEYGINLCMEVRDTGNGMTRDELALIRDGIYHAEERNRHLSEGLGLGLPIVYGIAHAMDGFVRVESEAGKGTRVHVSIPQEVVDGKRCMDIADKSRLKLAFYQQPGKFEVPAVREYYTQMIMHIIRAFSLKLERASTLPDLKAMLEKGDYTHLFIADEEYAEDPSYFDTLSESIHVIVVARLSFTPSADSRVTILRKPLYAFPLVEALNAETEQDAKAALAEAADPDYGGVRALVVDDEEMNVVVAKGILSEYGIVADGALSGEEAVEKARRTDYAVIFMDHMMPGMDGIQCAHRIRDILSTEGRSCAMIALTANAVSGAREMFEQEGFDAFVAKPVERTEMTRALHRVLSREGAQETGEETTAARQPFTWRRESEALSGVIDGTERADAYEAPVIMTPRGTEEAPGAGAARDEGRTAPAKRRVRITCDSACDLPSAWYDEWDISVVHHILHTKTGSFLDGDEINGDELVLYMKSGGEARSEVPGTIAFARFFTEQLAHADEVIHISIADASSPVYKFAETSLKRMEGVTLVDSGSMSGGAGLLVLYAAYLAKETELHADAILARLKKVKAHITARFVLENTGALLAGGRISPVTSRWLDAFMLHPTIDMRNSMMQFSFVWSGLYGRRFIRRVLRRKWRVDTSLLIITHAGLSVAALSEIREEVEKHVHFDRVVVMPGSSAIVVNVGAGTFGLQFHTLSGDRETGGRLFDFLPEEI